MPLPWNKIEYYFKKNYIKYLEKLYSKPLLSPKHIDFNQVKRILIVRFRGQLGDFLLCTPALKALRKRFPKATIGIIVRSYFADIVVDNPYIDQVMVFYENGFQWTPKRLWCLWSQLYHRWDMAVVLSLEGHSLTSDFIAHLSGAKYILGSDRFVFPGCSRNFFYNLIVPASKDEIHQTERNMELVKYIGAESNDLKEWIHINEFERNRIYHEFIKLYSDIHKPLIGLHIGANKMTNRWSIDKFCELAQSLYSKYHVQIIVFWGPKEEKLSKEFLNSITFKPIVIKPSTLRKLALYYTLCDAVVCNDTGTMHLCAAVGTPLVSVFGPTDPDYWKPKGDCFIAVRGKNQNVENVTVDQVRCELLKLLKVST